MKKGFWDKLNKPFFALAPMHDVTDAAFRRIVAKYSKPDIIFTEFVSCDGLCSEGKEKLMHYLISDKSERPIVAQFFGAKPENFYRSAQLAQGLGFDGIDINMGCSVKNILKQESGSKLIENPDLAREIIRETKRGAGDLPISVKTRIGYSKNTINEWIKVLLEEEPSAITIHGRTAKQGYAGQADWDAIGEAVKQAKATNTLIIGNGDVKNINQAKEKVEKYGVDGVMIGRAILGNPWLFSQDLETVPLSERLSILLEHTFLFEKLLGKAKSFSHMRKHFGAYLKNFPDAKQLRIKLMSINNANEVEKIITDYLA